MKFSIAALAAVLGFIVTGVPAALATADEPATQAANLPAGQADPRIKRILQANMIATHAYQVLVAARDAKADKECFANSGLSEQELQALIDHQKALLTEKPQAVKAWVDDKPTDFDPAKDLNPILDSKLRTGADKSARGRDLASGGLPVNVLVAYFKEKSPKTADAQAMSLASLMQMMLDIERDADVLQNMFVLYHELGLPLYMGQLGIPDVTDEELLAFGKELSPRLCATPFETTPKALQTHGRKMYNWGRRYTGERDVKVLAAELLAEPEIKAIVPLLEKMPAQKIAVIGHSYTMGVHWASPSAFVPISDELLRNVNPKVEIRQWQAGGLTAERAYGREKFYEQALAWKPDRVLLVLGGRGKANDDAMQAMVEGFTRSGIDVMIFDTLRPTRPRPTTAGTPASGSAAGAPAFPPPSAADTQPAYLGLPRIHVIEVGKLLDTSPDRSKFSALDGIHMTEPWHRLMAKEWLKYLCGARQEKLEAK